MYGNCIYNIILSEPNFIAGVLGSQLLIDVLNLCPICENKLLPSSVTRCSQSKAVSYCGKDCHSQHRKRGHKWYYMDMNGNKGTRG